MDGIGALYVHVPFCARKCAYCDFTSVRTHKDDPGMAEYANDLMMQIRACTDAGLLDSCTTAYIGGGTPSLLGAQILSSLVASIRKACPRIIELTCEANPDSLTDDVITAARDAGATRLSVGVQSFDDDELRALGRLHTAAQARDRVQAAVASGLDVSVDLMCAIPEQTDESWERTLAQTLTLGVGHISVYPLAIEEGTPFGERFDGVPTPWNDEDMQAARMEMAELMLQDAGYARYEVASYALHGKECAHNTAYWTGVPYLGLGRGAASMLGTGAYEAARSVIDWLPEREPDAFRMRFSTLDQEVEFMNEREAWAEDLMLGMRLTRGLPQERFCGAEETVAQLNARGLLCYREDRVVPTYNGWLLGNELFGALWDLARA